jgi:hypothetical protein
VSQERTQASSFARVLSLFIQGLGGSLGLSSVLPRSVSAVLEGDRETTTSAEFEAVSHALTLELSSREPGAELFRCCTEVDHVSTVSA